MLFHIFLTVIAYCVYPVEGLKLTVLHTNDMHSYFEQTSATSGICPDDNSTACYGGFARIRSAVTALKAKGTDNNRFSIFINAGDTFQGTPYYTIYKWKVVADIMNLMEFDVVSLGNHEFDDGTSGLLPYINNLTTPTVACNLNLSNVEGIGSGKLPKSTVLEVNGTRIGIIGYITPETMVLSSTGNVKILDEIPSIQAEANRLTNEGVNVLIALGHSGYAVDQQIAKEVPELDLVVGGHSHSFLYTGTPPDIEVPVGPYPTTVVQESGKKVPVVQAYAYSKYLGYIELEIDDEGNVTSYQGSPILLNGSYEQDENITAALLPWKNQLYPIIKQKIGTTKVYLDSQNKACKLHECNLGNLIVDAFVDFNTISYSGKEGWTDAPIGLIQGGGIRTSIDASGNDGELTVEDLLLTMPFNTKVCKLKMSGAALKEAFEHSVHRYDDTIDGHVGEFLQVSGLKVTYNLSAAPYSRVVSLEVLCGNCTVPQYTVLDPMTTYGIIIPVYLVNGGDGFTAFKNASSSVILNLTDYEIVKDYLTRRGVVYPGIEGRLTILTSDSVVSFYPPLQTSFFIVFILYIVTNIF